MISTYMTHDNCNGADDGPISLPGEYHISAVLPSAGIGSRMKWKCPKQIGVVCGKPLIQHTVEGFLRVGFIADIVVVCSPETFVSVQAMVSELDTKRVHVIVGEDSRHRSIYCGIRYLAERLEKSPDLVVLHDGVRPIVPEELLKEVVLAAIKHGAAGPVVPLVSTIFKPDSNFCLDSAPDRSSFVASEMPQVVRMNLLQHAYKNATRDELDHGTDCLVLVRTHCPEIRPKLVRGDPDLLWKITYRKDLVLAETALAYQNKRFDDSTHVSS